MSLRNKVRQDATLYKLWTDHCTTNHHNINSIIGSGLKGAGFKEAAGYWLSYLFDDLLKCDLLKCDYLKVAI